MLIYFSFHIDVFLTVLRFLAGITLKICEFQVRLSSKNYTYSSFNTLKKLHLFQFQHPQKNTLIPFSIPSKNTLIPFSRGQRHKGLTPRKKCQPFGVAYRSNYKLLFQELASDFRAVGKCSRVDIYSVLERGNAHCVGVALCHFRAAECVNLNRRYSLV